VIDAVVAHLIERQIVRDGRSLLQYVDEAYPYTPARAEQERRRIAELAKEEQAAVGRLIRFLHRHHVTPPLLGAFPSSFTTINFVSLEHLLPALQKESPSWSGPCTISPKVKAGTRSGSTGNRNAAGCTLYRRSAKNSRVHPWPRIEPSGQPRLFRAAGRATHRLSLHHGTFRHPCASG
jgi:hypothetical protein